MVAAFVLVTGVLLLVVVGGVALVYVGFAHLLTSLVPLAPWLVMVGTFLLILTELLLFLGDKDDRKTARRDLTYLLPILLVSAGLWYIAQYYLW